MIEEKIEVDEEAKDAQEVLESSQKLKNKPDTDLKTEVITIARPASGRSRN